MLNAIRRLLTPALLGFPLALLAAPSDDTVRSSLQDPALNPWILPLQQCAALPADYELNLDMGFINTDYACTIDRSGVHFDTRTIQTTNADAARLVLGLANQCAQLASTRVLVGASRNNVDQLRALLPNAGPDPVIQIGKSRRSWSNPETHAKVFQLGNGRDQYFTVHGSLNLQTVGMTCKANNAMRFVESNAALFARFRQLSKAVESGDGLSAFDSEDRTQNSSGTTPAVEVGSYLVHFYAGRGDGFVGGDTTTASRPFPLNLNPPVRGRHEDGLVNWYDNILYDAAAQLRLGRHVRLDVLIFEIGQQNAFVLNLWKFIAEGFSSGWSEDRTARERVDTQYPGKLTVRFLWQFQSSRAPGGPTYGALHGPDIVASPDGHYRLEKATTWNPPGAGLFYHPTTPYDMHNKVMLMDVEGHADARRIYVTSSNLDQPGMGSGKLWQAGTIVTARPGTTGWTEASRNQPSLWNAYQRYFTLLWENRDGQPQSGQLAFHTRILREHANGLVNWIETKSPSENADKRAHDGIDAFFFPIPMTVTAATP